MLLNKQYNIAHSNNFNELQVQCNSYHEAFIKDSLSYEIWKNDHEEQFQKWFKKHFF